MFIRAKLQARAATTWHQPLKQAMLKAKVELKTALRVKEEKVREKKEDEDLGLVQQHPYRLATHHLPLVTKPLLFESNFFTKDI